MEEVALALYFLFWGVVALSVAIILVYLIAKRIKDKGREDFEQRSN